MRKFYYLNNTIGKADVIPFDIISIISNEKYQFFRHAIFYYLNNIKIPSMKILW